jgi:hypothetical protein
MRAKAEARPDLTVPVGGRRPPIARAPTLAAEEPSGAGRPSAIELAAIEDHGDAWVAPEGLGQLLAELRAIAADDDEPATQPAPAGPCAIIVPGAGEGPGDGAHMPLVDPGSIAVLAIVLVASGRPRHADLPGPGVRETFPENLPVLRKTAQTQPRATDRPLVPEWIVHQKSPGQSAGARIPAGPLAPVPHDAGGANVN